jgi:hypothetical protein
MRDLNDNQIMEIIIDHMISQVSNKEYIEKLNIILDGIKGKSRIDEIYEPRYQSIILFGFNIFIFKMKEYRLIVEEILRRKEKDA